MKLTPCIALYVYWVWRRHGSSTIASLPTCASSDVLRSQCDAALGGGSTKLTREEDHGSNRPPSFRSCGHGTSSFHASAPAPSAATMACTRVARATLACTTAAVASAPSDVGRQKACHFAWLRPFRRQEQPSSGGLPNLCSDKELNSFLSGRCRAYYPTQAR